ncbi:zinc-finger homeodomain protein 4 [Euphorbia lathyris]|uniref:zinc-finger homeodomain protein 4 n=1 Tax=Euphorbia lathyris TaxID=212925 RepID=UPI003313CF47
MEISSHEEEEEGEIPLPINSTYVGGSHGHMIHHHHHHNNNNIIPQIPNNNVNVINGPDDHHHHHQNLKKMVKYRECLKNHAASMGGNATDGCGEFMPSGEEGSIEALTCSACNCHRNFHRKEIEGESPPNSTSFDYYHNHPHFRRKLILGHHKNSSSIIGPEYPTAGGAARAHHHQMIMSYNMVPSDQSDEQEDGGGVVIARPTHHQVVMNNNNNNNKKRFRTKFSVEQKEKMLNFAEKVGWKIQKQEEGVVQHFCQEIGVKRRVLKVWMHNNKHNLAKKILLPPSLPPPPPPPPTA